MLFSHDLSSRLAAVVFDGGPSSAKETQDNCEPNRNEGPVAAAT